MDFADQLATDGSFSHPVRDLRNVPLEELARQAHDGHDSIQDIVERMIGDGCAQPPVTATMFNSAIG